MKFSLRKVDCSFSIRCHIHKFFLLFYNCPILFIFDINFLFFFFISTKGYLYFSIKRPFSLFVRLFGFNIGVRIILQKKKKTIDDRRRGQKYCQKSWLDFWTIGKKWQSFFFFKKKLFGTKENKIFQCYIFQLVNFKYSYQLVDLCKRTCFSMVHIRKNKVISSCKY